MKANHNSRAGEETLITAGVNISSSKNESKSQRGTIKNQKRLCWCKYQ